MTTFGITAFDNADLFGHGRVAEHAQFVMPTAPTLNLTIFDDDNALSGDAHFNEFGDDLSGQYGSITRASDGAKIGAPGRFYAERTWDVTDENGETYTLVEVEQPGFRPDSFTFLGDVPPAGAILTVGHPSNVTGKGLAYDQLSAEPPAPNIVDIAAGSDDFNILVLALQTAGLDGVVRAAEDITVFAPTDTAFTQLAVDLGFDGDTADEGAVFGFIAGALTDLAPDGDPIPLLQNILTYHVSPGAKTAAEIDAADQVTTLLEGATFGSEGTELVDNEPDIDNPNIVIPDLAAGNGTIQVIDRVLLPIDIPGNEPNIVDIAAGSDDFNILVLALQTAGLDGVVRAAEDITVFAPTDAAFTQLAVDLGFDGDTADEGAVFGFIAGALTDLAPDGDPIPLLQNILTYHVSPGAKTAAEIDAADQVTTLLEGATFGSEGTELVDNEPDVDNPNIVIPDLAAGNGTIQVIDRVLLPIDIPGNEPVDPEPELPTLTGIVAASGGTFDDNGTDFDILLNAVTAADLAGALDDPNANLTVFAPSDAAFVSLSQTLGFAGSDEAGAFDYLVEALALLNGGDAIPLLKNVLLYHVAPEALDSTAVLGATDIPTLLTGASLGVDGTSLVDADPDIADPNLIATDIPASNGIAHVLDGVLLPADLLRSDGSNDVDFLIKGDQANQVYTGRDNDFVDGNGGNDKIFLGKGDDVGLGGSGKDYISGGRGNDIINGGDGADYLRGGSGDDIITGGADNDVMIGNSGADTFVFALGDGHDTIRRFEQGHDKIDISATGITDFETLSANIEASRFGSTIQLGDDQSIHVQRWHLNLEESDFIFAPDTSDMFM